MDKAHMEPFIQETINTFNIMFGSLPEEKELEEKNVPESTYDVSALIGISGAATGGVVISFPEKVACKLVSIMLSEDITEVNQDVSDGVGELVNIVAGNAKRGLTKFGFGKLDLSLPNVVVGRHRTVWRSKDMPCLMKRFFSSKFGPFCIEVNVRPNQGPGND